MHVSNKTSAFHEHNNLNKAMVAIVVCDKIQSHDHIFLVHNIATLQDFAFIEASVIDQRWTPNCYTVRQMRQHQGFQ